VPPGAIAETQHYYTWSTAKGTLGASRGEIKDDQQQFAPAVYGTISWTGYAVTTSSGVGSTISLTGVVTSSITGQAVGSILLGGRPELNVTAKGNMWPEGTVRVEAGVKNPQSLRLYVPPTIANRLSNDIPTAGYWDAVPPCDTITDAQKQSDVANSQQENLLLRLPPIVRQRLQQ